VRNKMVIQSAFLGIGFLLGVLSLYFRRAKIILLIISVCFCFIAVAVASAGVKASHTFAITKQNYGSSEANQDFIKGARETSEIASSQLPIFYIAALGLGVLLVISAYRDNKKHNNKSPSSPS
jgi:hypothetical protein